MSFKAKIAVFSTVALLAVAGGMFAFSSNEPDSAIFSTEAAQTAKVAEQPDMAAPAQSVVESASETAAVPATDATTAQAPVAPDKPATPVSGKLTREQLMPPEPKTEDEKLQKAAEQEYNSF